MKLALCLQEVQALEAYTQKRRAEFGMYQLAHVGRTKAVQQRLIRANARECLLQLVEEDDEKGELAWRHRTHRRQESPISRNLDPTPARRGATAPFPGTSKNAQDDALAQDNMKNAVVVLTAHGLITSPLIVRPPISSVPPEPPVWCRVPCHHCYFNAQMPNTCPYGGSDKTYKQPLPHMPVNGLEFLPPILANRVRPPRSRM